MAQQDIVREASILLTAFKNITASEKVEEPTTGKFFTENPNPILRLDKNGVIHYANQASSNLLQNWGCKIGDSIQECNAKDVSKLLQTAINEALQSQCSKSIEVESNDMAHLFWVVPVSQTSYVDLYGQDIKKRKMAELALKEAQEKFRKLFDEVIDAIFVADAETGTLLDCNKTAAELVCRSKSEVVGMHPGFLHPLEEVAGEFSKAFENQRKHEGVRVFEDQIITKTGEARDFIVKTNPMEIDGKKVLQYIFKDVTECKQMEKHLQDLEYRLNGLSPGCSFLCESHERLFKAFADLTFRGVPSLCIVREDPDKLVKEYGVKPEEVRLLSSKPLKGFQTLQNLQAVSLAISEFLKAKKSGVVLLDGLEYLISNFGFDAVYCFLQEKRFDFLENKAILLIPANMATLTEKEKALLASELKILDGE